MTYLAGLPRLPQNRMLAIHKPLLVAFCSAWIGLASCASAWAGEAVRFDTQVMAVLSRAGCNAGACHGNLNGKNGFKLSLRGQDPSADYLALSRDMLGRRADAERPEQSLLLLKATAAIPHEGGKRFRKDSSEYRILAEWIAGGMKRDATNLPQPVSLDVTPADKVVLDPAEIVRLSARARFSDGSVHDVTGLAAFDVSTTQVTVSPEGVVQSDRCGEATVLVRYLHLRKAVSLAFVAPHADLAWPELRPANFIDELVFRKLRSLHLTPSRLCADGVFLKRAYLDLLGVLPTVAETRAFLANAASNKRAVDRLLLQRPEFADFWALKWSDILHNEEKAPTARAWKSFTNGSGKRLVENKPLNEFARELISRARQLRSTASGFYRAVVREASRA